jgi:hypothetical protein
LRTADRRRAELSPIREKESEDPAMLVAHTHPELGLFQAGQPLHTDLVDVCRAYSTYRPDTTRYSSYIPPLAALLLLHMPPANAFCVLANLLNRPIPLSFHTGDASGKHQTYALTFDTLQKKLPLLYKHFMDVDVPPEVFDMFYLGMFAGGKGEGGLGLGVDAACRVLDVYVFENDRALVRGCVAVLSLLEHALYGSCEEVVGVLAGKRGGEGLKGIEEGHFVDVYYNAGKVNS